MKIIAEVFSHDELSRITELLHSKGIPTTSTHIGVRGDYKTVLFVCLEQQYEDALTVMNFPNHTPK